ncbi:hypothetical protein HS088_TW08G00307 [Tripterygium wilfordii]|uniref:Uncharacterized protein n=2 Tax=Tripterygium wilfordii TaxID=458696 RepID=A0A7J7DBJ2_TRIWF|nr:hypothetical protein HS088_TW08G00307 [Tripterygium wilfordii]
MDYSRFGNDSSTDRKSTSLQKKIAETRRQRKTEQAPDLTHFMNDIFFGTVNNDKNKNDFNGGGGDRPNLMEQEADFDDSIRSTSSRLTQEWLQEARRMVASSPSRTDSPSRLIGSPRFTAVPGRLSTSSLLERRDPLSRSARRQRPVERISEEILTKSAKQSSSNNSVSVDSPDTSPASAVQKWLSNILKPSNSPPSHDPTSLHNTNQSLNTNFDPTAQTLPPRLSIHRKSRFQTESPAPPPPGIPVPSRRTFKPAPLPADTKPLSPPKNLVKGTQRRSISTSRWSVLENNVQALSPPRNLVESANRRSISKSTCSVEKIAPKINGNPRHKEEEEPREASLNGFLREQRTKMGKILYGEIDCKAKVVLSGPSNSISSMVAAICYAWLLETKARKNKERTEANMVVPVMNVRRSKMWKLRQAAWLFHQVGLDATSLLFADEVQLENLLMSGKLSIMVVGQDVLRTNGEVGSECTILTDNYCEDAYELLQTPLLNKLLLAGILLDTQNLNGSASCSMTRDAEAVQLLLVGSAPNYRNTLFDQLMQDQRDNTFHEVLLQNYGKPPTESHRSNGALVEHRVPDRKLASVLPREPIAQNSDIKKSNDAKNTRTNGDAPKPAKPNASPAQAPPAATNDSSRGKNKFFLSKWFGFGK